MIKIFKKAFPNVFPKTHIAIGRFYDIYKFSKTCSSINKGKNKEKLKSFIIRQYHGIEKGFTLANTKNPFGIDLANELIKNINIYIQNYGEDDLIKHATSILITYANFISKNDDIIVKDVCSKINRLKLLLELEEIKPTKTLTLQEVIDSSDFNFTNFIKSRKSIRDFDTGDVDLDVIKSAIIDAMEAPSACNRQGWRVRLFEKEEKDLILSYQNGNRGFNNSINKVLLVTGVSTFYSYTERNGMLIDGALFAMTLILSLHSKKIGTCPLNTSYTLKDELKLRKAINLSITEEPIMMIAIGNLKSEFKVAKSPRVNIDSVLIPNGVNI